MPGFRSSAPAGGPLSGNSPLFPPIEIPTPIVAPKDNSSEFITSPYDRIGIGDPSINPRGPIPGNPIMPHPVITYPGTPPYDPNRLSNPEGGK